MRLEQTTPKKARKFKKPASPSKKRTLVTMDEEEPERKHQQRLKDARGLICCGSSDGADFELEVPDDPKGKSIDTSEGTSLKPGVPDVSKADSSESKYESWGDSGDEANVKGDDEDNQEINDDEEETDDEFVHTPLNYVPTNDETNDESNDVDKEEYDRIDKELDGDVNVRLTDAEQDDEGEEIRICTFVAYVQKATTEVPPFSSSHSVSSNYTSAFLNLENLHHNCLSNNNFFPLSSLFPSLQQSTLISTPTITEATTSASSVLESKTLNDIHLRLSDLEKEVKELKNVDHSSALLSTIKSKVLNSVKEYLGTSLDDTRYKVLYKHPADVVKEHSVPAEIINILRKQYVP
ncbi:hypothetical protein Tco_0718279 [Tanacetum coccineum]